MALHDALTGLPNQVLLEDRICKVIQLPPRNHDRAAMCFIDLDHFKNINDAYGHKAGDALLLSSGPGPREEPARRRHRGAGAATSSSPCCRPVQPKTPGPVARKLQKMMPRSFCGWPTNRSTPPSAWASQCSPTTATASNPCWPTPTGRCSTPVPGRNNFQLFSEMSARAWAGLYIQAKLADAIQGGQIEVWFQPQVRTERDAEGRHRLVGIEALARWHDNDLGWISPATFIPMAEASGLIMTSASG